jgi:chromosome segregation ATPase
LTRKDSTINGKIPINISNNDLLQNFNFDIDFSFLNLQPDDIIHFYLEIYDNDAISGPKSTKSREYEIKIPTKEEIQIDQSKQLQAANSKFANMQKELNDVKNELKQLENQWKLERKFNYEQKQKWENLIKKQNDIINELHDLEQNLQLSPSYDENLEIYEKIQQIDELIKSINLDELNEYLENLQKLMENNELKSEDIEEFKSQNEELNKMLDRQIDLLKRLDI